MVDYEYRISPAQGNYIATESTDFELLLDKKSLVLGNTTINVGDSTDLFGWFDSSIRFCGFLEDSEAIFYLGQGNGDLFTDGAFYYDLTLVIDVDRIGKSYKAGTFRDSF